VVKYSSTTMALPNPDPRRSQDMASLFPISGQVTVSAP
jgi:hypothetical protein